MLLFVVVVVRRGSVSVCLFCFVCFSFPLFPLFFYSLFLFVIRTQERLKKMFIKKKLTNFSMKTRFQKPRFCQCTKPGPQRSKLYTYASVVIVT